MILLQFDRTGRDRGRGSGGTSKFSHHDICGLGSALWCIHLAVYGQVSPCFDPRATYLSFVLPVFIPSLVPLLLFVFISFPCRLQREYGSGKQAALGKISPLSFFTEVTLYLDRALAPLFYNIPMYPFRSIVSTRWLRDVNETKLKLQ